jgi:hypothetical protein
VAEADIPTVPHLVKRLRSWGVQLWHNRGRLYAGPLAKLGPDERALLAHHKDELIGYLKRFPMQPHYMAELVAPRPKDEGGWEGSMSRKPWHYEAAVILPHLGTRDLLDAAVCCWRHQTVSPYLIVVDTGTDGEQLADMQELRSYDLELHEIAAHGWRHSSAPVAAALDLAFAVCQQDRAILTHTDVFPRHDRVIEELLDRVTPSCPVVGYQMSKRQGSNEWLSCVSHTLTAVDMRVMRRERVSWNLLAVLEADNELEERYLGWPDTETQFGRSLRAAGIVPEFLGGESNAHVYQTDLIVHWRSATSVRHYLPHQVDERHPGLAAWLEATRDLGRAAPLPEAPST